MIPRHLVAADFPAPPPSMGKIRASEFSIDPLPDFLSPAPPFLPCQHIFVTLCLVFNFTAAQKDGVGAGRWKGVVLDG